jgi:hypothetical protein
MVITSSQSATVRTLGKHRPDAALLWKLSVLFWKAVAVDRPDARSSRPDTLRYFGNKFLLKYHIGTKLSIRKAKKKFCKLSIPTANRSVQTISVQTETFARPDGPAENSRITFQTGKTWLVRTAQDSSTDARASESVFDSILGFQSL